MLHNTGHAHCLVMVGQDNEGDSKCVQYVNNNSQYRICFYTTYIIFRAYTKLLKDIHIRVMCTCTVHATVSMAGGNVCHCSESHHNVVYYIYYYTQSLHVQSK